MNTIQKIVSFFAKDKRVGYRRSGQTTRLADGYIQILFKEGRIVAWDHYGSNAATIRLCEIIMRRLELEHGINVNNYLHVNRIKFIITLKKEFYSDRLNDRNLMHL